MFLQKVTVFSFVSLLVIQSSWASCKVSPLKKEKTESGAIRAYCEYDGEDSREVTALDIGEKLTTDNCLKCLCTKFGLSCCSQGSLKAPRGCDVVMVKCRPQLVMAGDHSKDCVGPEVVPLT